MILIFFLVLLFPLAVAIFMQQRKFGKIPAGDRLAQLQASPHYRDGQVQNLNHTPQFTEGANPGKIMMKMLFGRSKNIRPTDPIPSQKTNLHALRPDENILVWFGHSSYFIQVDGKKILVDPVFSHSASPLGTNIKSFEGSNVYTPEDMPEIDFLFISHDHWDHVDYPTLIQLKPKLRKIICGLGTASHFEYWGFRPADIIEKAWNEHADLGEGFAVTVTPGRHFSGRGFSRNRAMWVSFVLSTPSMKLFLGGDSGYDNHFEAIGAAHGPFDLAILECGQYDNNWRYIHMHPEEVVQAAEDLKAKTLLPVHWAKFALANHAWNEPINRVTAAGQRKGMPMIHPMIGEPVNLNNMDSSARWWADLK